NRTRCLLRFFMPFAPLQTLREIDGMDAFAYRVTTRHRDALFFALDLDSATKCLQRRTFRREIVLDLRLDDRFLPNLEYARAEFPTGSTGKKRKRRLSTQAESLEQVVCRPARHSKRFGDRFDFLRAAPRGIQHVLECIGEAGRALPVSVGDAHEARMF